MFVMGSKVTGEEESLARNTTPTPFPLPTRPIIQPVLCIVYTIYILHYHCTEHHITFANQTNHPTSLQPVSCTIHHTLSTGYMTQIYYNSDKYFSKLVFVETFHMKLISGCTDQNIHPDICVPGCMFWSVQYTYTLGSVSCQCWCSQPTTYFANHRPQFSQRSRELKGGYIFNIEHCSLKIEHF